MTNRSSVFLGFTLLASILFASAVIANDSEPSDGSIVQYGGIHEAIGQQQHQGRVAFREIIRREHFYGVGAAEGLQGEATIIDGTITLTTVDLAGRLQSSDRTAVERKATLLVGAYVNSWTKQTIEKTVAAKDFDQYIANAATKVGANVKEPFVFTINGKFSNVRLHVINGACPIRARMKKENLSNDKKPFESDLSVVSGTIVGVYAADSVGKLTHPSTSTHCHLVYTDPITGKRVTAHLEQLAIQAGAQLSVPQP